MRLPNRSEIASYSRAFFFTLSLGATAAMLTGCGTLTGLPAHGGGKRFAIEQELVAASARAAAKDIQLDGLRGRRVALFVTVMGDEGSGTFTGGRYSLDALVRGDYISGPTTTTQNTYPIVGTRATTTMDDISSVTTAETALNAPSTSRTKTKGGNSDVQIGARYGGVGEYRNETLITNPRDVTFLTNLLQITFFLRGIEVVPPSQADTDVFITVDVFGTVRDRTDWHILNVENLAAQTKLEIFAVDRKTRALLIKPRASSFEAKYSENYALWVGPFQSVKTVHKADALLVNFSDMDTPPQITRTNGVTIPLAPGGEEQGSPNAVENAIKSRRQ